MRIKVCLGLVAGVALLAVAACGGDDDKKKETCPVEQDEAGVERAVDCAHPHCGSHPSCEVCDDGIDNTGNGLVDCDDPFCAQHPSCEICDDGIDNTGNGLVDCADPACQDDEACGGWICDDEGCVQGCERQTPDCAGSPYGGLALTSICNQGRCEEVGRVKKDGEAEVAELDLRVQIDGVGAPKGLRSAVVDVLYKERSGGEGELTCVEVRELLRDGALRDHPSINIAAHNEMEVQANEGSATLSISLNRVPLHKEEKPYLVVAHFYNGDFQGVDGRAQGALVAFACATEVEATAGEVTLRARNACEPNEPESCQDGWSCRLGICAYDCSIQCNLNQACREVDGKDVCLQECGKLTPCDEGEVCDQSFPWNVAACIPK